jgi:glycosyltransferase involved in cell wall biosynthesis
MRVVHVESGLHLYGGARQVRYLLGGLQAAGVANVLVCARGGALAASSPAAEVIELPMTGDFDFALPGRLRRVLAATRPDLVHVHSRRGAEIAGGVAARLARVPAILTRRVDSAEPGPVARLKYRPYRAVVAISRAVEAQLAAQGVERGRTARISSAVDTQLYRPEPSARARVLAAFELPADALLVGVVAQLIPRKGHRLLLAELPALVRSRPSVRVLCFGRGPLEADLRAEIAALGLADRVRLAGFRDDLPQLLPGLDVLAHPAQREGLGVALLEAASCGVPAVACAAGGVPEVVAHGRTGLLVGVDDGAALRAALERLLAAPAERATLGAAARADVERRFSIAAMVDAYRALYVGVLGADHARARGGIAS